VAKPVECELTIASLGALGDGIAETESGRIHVPFTLPGERVHARVTGDRGEALAILDAAADRATPACPHFGVCGGCALQHMSREAELAWKRQRVMAALGQRGFADPPVEPVHAIPPGTRRRVAWRAFHGSAGMALGYHRRSSHELVDARACPVIAPELATLMPALRDGLTMVLPRGAGAALHATLTDAGVDLAVSEDRPAPDGHAAIEARTALAARLDLARLVWNGEVLAERRPARVTLSGVAVPLPPGGFLQASRVGEEALVLAVLSALGAGEDDDSRNRRRPVRGGGLADLFAGIGTFTLAAAPHMPVHAVEGDGAACAALSGAVRHAPGLRPVTVERGGFRCGGFRSAARGRKGAGHGNCRLWRAGGGGGVVQSRDFRARCADPRRWRLPPRLGAAGGPVPLDGPY
jgi:23S rRNA (uracil1939-C5)-methyltransferase